MVIDVGVNGVNKKLPGVSWPSYGIYSIIDSFKQRAAFVTPLGLQVYIWNLREFEKNIDSLRLPGVILTSLIYPEYYSIPEGNGGIYYTFKVQTIFLWNYEYYLLH